MNINSLSLVSTLSLPARLSATSATAKWMNWPSQPVSFLRGSPAFSIGGSASSSGFKRDRFAADQAGVAATGCHDVIGNEVIGPRQHPGQDQIARGRMDRPGLM